MSSKTAETSISSDKDDSSSTSSSESNSHSESGPGNEDDKFNNFYENLPANEAVATVAGLSPPVRFCISHRGLYTYC